MADTSRDRQSASQKDLDDLHRKFDEHYSERMDRIENKLDQLADAVVSIARAEEKIAVLIEDTREIKEVLNSNNKRLSSLEIDVEKNKAGLSALSKFFWIAVGSVASVLAAMVINTL